jgi:hypothetical protein
MPLARYFLWVGAVLLALLFVADLFLPELPPVESADSRLPAIHIQSIQKWPDRVVYDTSIPTIIPAPSAKAEANVPAPPTVADISTAAREAFAQSRPSDAKQPQRSDARKREARQRHHKFAARRAAPSALLAARQPFGWFGTGFWYFSAGGRPPNARRLFA